MEIKGAQKTSLLDYPGRICTVIFLNRCNFRCPYCHNPELVFDEIEESIDEDEILNFLKSKKGWIDGVSVTGGEPMLHKDLPDFAGKVKKMGLLFKVDTNGTNPGMLKRMIDEKLVDFIAMDVKAGLENYDKAANVKVNKTAIKQSIDLIMGSGIEYEFRATVAPGIFTEKDAKSISAWLNGAKKFVLQQFRNTERTLDPEFRKKNPYLIGKLEEFQKILKETISEVEIRGV